MFVTKLLVAATIWQTNTLNGQILQCQRKQPGLGVLRAPGESLAYRTMISRSVERSTNKDNRQYYYIHKGYRMRRVSFQQMGHKGALSVRYGVNGGRHRLRVQVQNCLSWPPSDDIDWGIPTSRRDCAATLYAAAQNSVPYEPRPN